MTRDEQRETLQYAGDQAFLMHQDAQKNMPEGNDKQMFLFLMECALETIKRKIDATSDNH